jgi:hypothetical protein
MPSGVLYGCTIFVSSLLLFLIQPVIAQQMLPWFGGSAGVWVTAMLFFQSMLLGGYSYAWWTTCRLSPRGQITLHLVLLAASLAFLPVTPSAAWLPTELSGPVPRILVSLLISIGLPYLLLASTSPMLQFWYARSTKTTYPYRLFAISNLASLGALILYPFAIQPLSTVGRQLRIWSWAYAGYAVLAASVAWRNRSRATAEQTSPEPIALRDRLLWIALAACPSVLWLGTASVLSQDVAPIPFLWVLPLSLYLLSFVLCFDREGWYRPALYRFALPLAWVALCYALARQGSSALVTTIALLSAGLFGCCMFCHGELARRKPDSRRLTGFYLMLASGGALGGFFVGVVAPHVFNQYLEFPIAIVGTVLLALRLLYRYPVSGLSRLGIIAVAAFAVAMRVDSALEHDLLRSRNFFGTLVVSQAESGGETLRILSNGRIRHGSEFLSPEKSRLPTTYYGPDSGAALAIRALSGHFEHVGVVGLGTGTLAAYARPGDEYRFYEINPAVVEVANTQFRYLRDCAGKVEIILDDGRLSLARETGRPFDILVLDAFSGDSIPTHLLTAEAFQLYFSRLQANGVLAVHVTNRYLDLGPVVRTLAENAGRDARLVQNAANPTAGVLDATWVLVTGNRELLPVFDRAATPWPARPLPRLWTDDYSNLFGVLR